MAYTSIVEVIVHQWMQLGAVVASSTLGSLPVVETTVGLEHLCATSQRCLGTMIAKRSARMRLGRC